MVPDNDPIITYNLENFGRLEKLVKTLFLPNLFSKFTFIFFGNFVSGNHEKSSNFRITKRFFENSRVAEQVDCSG